MSNWDFKQTGYANAIFVIGVTWPQRHKPDKRVTLKRAIAQARACSGKSLYRSRRPSKPRDPGIRSC